MKNFYTDLYKAEYTKTFTVEGCIERYKKLNARFLEDTSIEMSIICDACAQVLHNKYGVDYETIEAIEAMA